MTRRRWMMTTGPVLAFLLAGAPVAAADSGPGSPVAPVAPIEASFAPIAPIAPIAPASAGPTSAGPRAPQPPRAPRLPQAPSVPAGVTAAQERIKEITGTISRLSGLGSLGASDGTTLDQASSDEVIAALRDGRALFSEPVAAPQTTVGADGCPTTAPEGTLRGGAGNIGIAQLCADSVAQAPTPEAAKAVQWALSQLGAPYACGGVGRMDSYRFDCSSLVTRAYAEGAGLATATDTWAPTTRELLPWDGAKLAVWADEVPPANVRPGDLLVYRTCDKAECSYQHVAMALADGYMLHTNRCGDVAHVTTSWGTGPEHNFAVARRVNPEAAR